MTTDKQPEDAGATAAAALSDQERHLCWADSGDTLPSGTYSCDRVKGHLGPHSWELYVLEHELQQRRAQPSPPFALSREAVEAIPLPIWNESVPYRCGFRDALDAVLRLCPADAPAQETTPWQPIETAPTDGRSILLGRRSRFDDRMLCDVCSWTGHDGDPDWCFSWHVEGPPTHWMPLPAPPAVPSPAPGAGEQPT